ncbi:MAG: DUF2461 domain-containing protein [Rhizobiales bacterium]|nr:DUF2461 domain-containing protein [Hyphomicrobiales bacterium]
MNDELRFSRFSNEAFEFLKDIKHNNNREWFSDNKQVYKIELESPAKQLLEKLKSSLILMTDVEMQGKIFRFHRDIRFSKDKSPYKNHVRILCYPEGRIRNDKGDIAIFYFSIEAEKVVIGIGNMFFDKPTLEKFRNALVDNEQSEDFLDIMQTLFDKGFTINDPALKRVPTGFDKNHPNAEWLKRKGMAVWYEMDVKKLQGPGSVGNLIDICLECQAFYDWMMKLGR